MKKVFQILLIILINNTLFAQNQKGTVYLNNGSKFTGLVKITNSNNVKYKLTRQSDKQTFKKEEIDFVSFVTKEGKTVEYAFRKIENSTYSSVKMMRVITKGKVTLYLMVTQGTHYANVPGFTHHLGTPISMSSYYLGKQNSEWVQRLTSKGLSIDKSFRKSVINYFKDCPELVKLIEDRTYRKKDIEEIVKYYNEKC